MILVYFGLITAPYFEYKPNFIPMTDLVRLGLQPSGELADASFDQSAHLSELASQIGVELGINAFHTVFDPRHKTAYYPEVIYPIRSIYKRMGERFAKGDVLIQIDDAVTAGKYLEALTLVDKGEAELAATKDLYSSELSSLFELKKAEADLATAYAQLAAAKRNFDATQIRAPYPGVVDSVLIEEHELPQSGKELIKIIQDDVLIAKLLIPAQLLTKISIGTPFNIAIENTNDVVWATVSRIGGMIDPSSSTIRIEAEVSNREYKYKPGMTGIATFNRLNRERIQ